MVALYRETFERHHGHTGRRPQVAISIPLMIGTSDAHALALAEPRLRHHWRYFADAAKSWEQVQSSAYQGYNEAMKNKMGGMDTADLDATAVLGTPDTVRQRIRALEADLSRRDPVAHRLRCAAVRADEQQPGSVRPRRAAGAMTPCRSLPDPRRTRP